MIYLSSSITDMPVLTDMRLSAASLSFLHNSWYYAIKNHPAEGGFLLK